MSEFLDFKSNIVSTIQDKVATKIAEIKIDIANKMFNANEIDDIDELEESKLHVEPGAWHVIHPGTGKIISTHKGYAGANAKMKKLSFDAHKKGEDSSYKAVSAEKYDRDNNIKKEAVEDLKGQKGTNTPSQEDMIAQSLLTLDKDGAPLMNAAGGRNPKLANPDKEILKKVGLKKK